jgi:hypothetical protein
MLIKKWKQFNGFGKKYTEILHIIYQCSLVKQKREILIAFSG